MAKDHFDFLAERIAAATALSELEARGTLRLALKASGLDAKNASAQALRVVVERVLSRELRARGVADAEALCTRLSGGLAAHAPEGAQPGAASSPEAVFARLGGA
jgi:hypothetical protein